MKISYKAISVALLIVLLVTILSPSGLVSGQNRGSNPGDYFLSEFLSGIGGAFAGGVAGSLMVKKMVASKGEVKEKDVAVITIVGLGIGLATGATVGVIAAGSLLGVNGNLLFAPLGAVFGVINAFGIIYWQEVEEGRELGPIIRTALALGAPAFGAVTGYNIGAKIKTKKTGKSGEDIRERDSLGTEMEFEFVLPLFKIDF